VRRDGVGGAMIGESHLPVQPHGELGHRHRIGSRPEDQQARRQGEREYEYPQRAIFVPGRAPVVERLRQRRLQRRRGERGRWRLRGTCRGGPCEAAARHGGVRRLHDDADGRGGMSTQGRGEGGEGLPAGVGPAAQQQDLHLALAADAESPQKVIRRAQVVAHQAGIAVGQHALCMSAQIPFQATAGQEPGVLAAAGDDHERARLAVGRAVGAHQHAEHERAAGGALALEERQQRLEEGFHGPGIMPSAAAAPALRGRGRVSRVASPSPVLRNSVSMVNPAPWVVHKFGGSSVADADCFRRVAAILESAPAGRLGVVLSACKGVTDALLRLVALAERADEAYRGEITQLRARHAGIAAELLSPEAAQAYAAILDNDCRDLAEVLRPVSSSRAASRAVSDLVSGYGEIWSTRLFQRFFAERARRPGPVTWLDARRVIVAEWGPLGPGVQWPESQARLREAVPADCQGTLVITGFIAADARGVQTTLGRNGSDFSASFFCAVLGATEIQIWTDVDGVMSADPRRVPDATVIDALSYNEAMELAYFGAKVIHPQTMAPAVKDAIPIWIRNTFAPEKAGTLICAQPTSALPIKGITSIERVALVNLEGTGMIGVPGTAHRLFGALREEGISVILISQGSSEHSICCAIPQEQAQQAAAIVRRAFEGELAGGQIQSVDVDPDQAILAVVGDGMAGTPGVAAKLFTALGVSRVNVRAIAQGASERNISAVVDGRSAMRALRAVHAG